WPLLDKPTKFPTCAAPPIGSKLRGWLEAVDDTPPCRFTLNATVGVPLLVTVVTWNCAVGFAVLLVAASGVTLRPKVILSGLPVPLLRLKLLKATMGLLEGAAVVARVFGDRKTSPAESAFSTSVPLVSFIKLSAFCPSLTSSSRGTQPAEEFGSQINFAAVASAL